MTLPETSKALAADAVPADVRALAAELRCAATPITGPVGTRYTHHDQLIIRAASMLERLATRPPLDAEAVRRETVEAAICAVSTATTMRREADDDFEEGYQAAAEDARYAVRSLNRRAPPQPQAPGSDQTEGGA